METQQQIEVYRQEAGSLKEKALALPITNDQEVVVASGTIKDIKSRLDWFLEFFRPIVESAFTTHKTACDRRNLVCDPLKEVVKVLNNRVAQYQWQQQKLREAEERRQQDIAWRKEQEKKAKLKAEAKEASKEGNHVRSGELRQEAKQVYVAPKPVAPTVKTDTTVRFTYDVVILSASDVPDQYKIVDVVGLKRLKLAIPSTEVPGIRFIKRPFGSTRGG